jgi:DNA-binding protein H-NS
MLKAQKKWDKRQSSAANYHYYREGHEEGVWVGRGAAMLGLFGPPTAKTLTAVASGLDPRTGKPLRQRQLAEGAARCTKDFTFSTPKSLSSLWMVAPPELQDKISRAQARAVLAAAKKLESLVCCRDRGAGAAKNAVHQTGVMVAAMFKHTTITRSEIATIHRQDASRGQSEDERKYIARYREAAEDASQGKTRESYDKMDALGATQPLPKPQPPAPQKLPVNLPPLPHLAKLMGPNAWRYTLPTPPPSSQNSSTGGKQIGDGQWYVNDEKDQKL